MSIAQFYSGKTLLITGCTGFVGKVVLEKIMRSLPNFNKIFILVRPKKGISPTQRSQKEIFSSPCFDVLRKDPSFSQMAQTKIVAIEGDICKDGLAMKSEVRQQLVEDLDIIINVAASVDFNEPIADAIQINYLGLLRILELAKECKKLQILTHVSTSYVNCDKRGLIEEKVYDIERDSEEIIQDILKMTPQEQRDNLDQILGEFPNTYTLTKSMGERTLKKKMPKNLAVCIVRPSIIASGEREPHIGWTDTLSAAGGFTLMIMSGLIRYLSSSYHTNGDIIPVDYVSNTIIVATALQANKPGLAIVQSGSTDSNPISWGAYLDVMFDYVQKQPIALQQFSPYCTFEPSQKRFEKIFHYKQEIPVQVLDKITKLVPGLRTTQVTKSIDKLNKLNAKVKDMINLFAHFTRHSWTFQTKRIYEYLDQLSPSERKTFYMDPKEYDWKVYLKQFAYGMEYFIFRQDVVDITQQKTWPLINKVKLKNLETERNILLKNPLVINNLEIIKQEIIKISAANQLEVTKYLQKVLNQGSPLQMKTNMVIAMKYCEKIFTQIIFNRDLLQSIKEDQIHSIVFVLPNSNSWLDIWILRLINQLAGVQQPITLNDVDFQNQNLKIATEQVIKRLVDSKIAIITTVESQVLKQIVENTQNALLIPVTINFDRVVQSSTPKTLETLKQIMNSKHNYGKVLLKYGTPIKPISKKYDLTKIQIQAQQKKNAVVMNTSLVAAALLMHRRGINFENLTQRVIMIYNELIAREVPVAATRVPTQKMIKVALSVINDHFTITKGIYEPKSSSIQELGMYSSQMLPYLLCEAIIATTVLGCSLKTPTFHLTTLQTKCQIIQQLFSTCVPREADLVKLLGVMGSRGMFQYENLNITVDSRNDQQCLKLSFLQNLILPKLETYLIALSWIAVSQNKGEVHEEEHLLNHIQWMIEVYLKEGVIKFKEASSHEYVSSAIEQLVRIGVLTKEKIVQRKSSKTLIKLTDKFSTNDLLDSITFYLPYCSHVDMEYLEQSIRYLTLSVLDRPKL